MLQNNLLALNSKISKQSFLDLLDQSSIKALWDQILKLQVQLYFKKELLYLQKHLPQWQYASSVLDVGSGNGFYLNQMSERYPGKKFYGFEKDSEYVRTSSEKYNCKNLTFNHGDVYEYQNALENSFDVVILHIVLQHLDNPSIALQNIYNYIKPGGILIIFDILDCFRRSSIKSSYLDKLVDHINGGQFKRKINKYALLDVMREIQNTQSSLSGMFKIINTNIDLKKNMIAGDEFTFKTNGEKEILFLQKLIYFQIWKQQYGLNVNLDKLYEIYKSFLIDEDSYLNDGACMLILEKSKK